MKEMINLLPPAAKKNRVIRVYLEHVGHLLRVVMVSMFLVFIVLIGVQSVTVFMNRIVREQAKDNSQMNQDTKEKVKRVNELVGSVNKSIESSNVITLLVPDIMKAKPKGVLMSNIDFGGIESGIIVKGTFNSREEILKYQRNLEKISWISKVEAPFQNFATGKKAGFVFTIHLNK